MTDIKIPHEYLPTLRRMREGSIIPSDMDLVDSLIAAAEADAPPLPVGWVAYRATNGNDRVLYHQSDGRLTDWKNTAFVFSAPGTPEHDVRISRCTPLVPTVDADGLEKAAIQNYYNGYRDLWEDGLREDIKRGSRLRTSRILRAAGVAVEGDETDGES